MAHLHEHHCESCSHEHHHHEHEHHHHEHSLKKQLWLIIITVVLLIIAVLIERGIIFNCQLSIFNLLLVYLVPYLIIGHETLHEAWEGILKGDAFNEHFLMSVATIGALWKPSVQPSLQHSRISSGVRR